MLSYELPTPKYLAFYIFINALHNLLSSHFNYNPGRCLKYFTFLKPSHVWLAIKRGYATVK